MEYIWTDDMRTVTGEDPADGYEQACKKMVIAGAQWIEANPNIRFQSPDGSVNESDENFISMRNVMACAKGNYGISGMQMEMAVAHVLAIKRMGWDGYCDEMRRLKRDESHGVD